MTATGTLRLNLPTPPKVSRARWYWVAGALATGLLIWLAFFRPGPSRILSIESKPAGAEVFLDGTPLGRTPLRQVVVKGKAGRLRLEKPDFEPAELRLKADDRDLFVRLLPAPFLASVATDPPGAEVFLDGQGKGRAPMSVEVPGEGTHTLRVTLEGHQPWSVTLERHKPLPDPIRLQKLRARKPEDGKLKKFFKGMFQK